MSATDPNVPPSRRPAFFGWIDWGALPGDLGRLPTGRSVRMPGLHLSIYDDTVSFAATPERIAVCVGRPRFADPALTRMAKEQGAAKACLELGRNLGDRLATALGGPFAVLFLDAGRRTLVIATDRFSTHPMCWFESPGVIAFSDRADSAAAASAVEIDPQSIFDYLYFHVIPTPRTLFRNVRRVPPACTLISEPRGTTLRRHWNPRFDESRAHAFEDLKREFRDTVERAVARECESGAPGCYLSGGTDSSTVAGMVTRVTGKPARTFSIGFDAEGYDEMRYARVAARHFGTEHHEYYVTPRDVAEGIPAIAGAYDQPFGNSSALPAYYCARLAGQAGVARLLAGDGGDELFGGNSRYAKQKIFEAYGLVPEALRTGVMEPVLLGGAGRLPLLRKAASYVRQAKTPMPDRMNAYNPFVRLGVEEILTPEFLAQIDVNLPAEHERAVYREATAESLVNRMLQYDWKLTLADNDLPKVYGTARLAGVEVAFPLLDDELVDLCLGLPASWKVKGTKLRYFFKEALRGFLPDEIINKRKHGFGLPFGVWMAKDARLRELSQRALESLVDRGLVRASFVRELVERRVSAHPAFYGEIAWVLVMLEEWLRHRTDVAAPRFGARARADASGAGGVPATSLRRTGR